MDSADTVTELQTLRWVSFAEGLSLLALVGIAMPLKYAMGMPLAVRWVGSAHGLLFVVFVMALFWASLQPRVPKVLLGLVFGLSFLPFGFVLAERRLKAVHDSPPRS